MFPCLRRARTFSFVFKGKPSRAFAFDRVKRSKSVSPGLFFSEPHDCGDVVSLSARRGNHLIISQRHPNTSMPVAFADIGPGSDVRQPEFGRAAGGLANLNRLIDLVPRRSCRALMRRAKNSLTAAEHVPRGANAGTGGRLAERVMRSRCQSTPPLGAALGPRVAPQSHRPQDRSCGTSACPTGSAKSLGTARAGSGARNGCRSSSVLLIRARSPSSASPTSGHE